MATGTTGGLLDQKRAQSVFKHAILKQYVIRFTTMTSKDLPTKTCWVVDGFAGRGRYLDGSAASAEHIMIAAQMAKKHTNIPVYLIEQSRTDYRRLDSVADEYRHRGIDVITQHGRCQKYLQDIGKLTKGEGLFLFLDPCGAGLPFRELSHFIGVDRGQEWPRTEALLNFSADLTRRSGGCVHKGLLEHPSVLRMDSVCNGTWWRDVAVNAFIASGGKEWESAAHAVADQYAEKLGKACRMNSIVVPVYRRAQRQPVYHLIFLTRASHGVWEFGDAIAKAREVWVRELGPTSDEIEGMLFDSVDEQLKADQAIASRKVKSNLLQIVADGRPHQLVTATPQVFAGVYGIAKETAITKAVRELVAENKISLTKAKSNRKSVIQAIT